MWLLTIINDFLRRKCCSEFFGCEESTCSQNGNRTSGRLDNVVQHSRELLSALALWKGLEPVWVWGRAAPPCFEFRTGSAAEQLLVFLGMGQRHAWSSFEKQHDKKKDTTSRGVE
jgi:hypothetical protein